jgi:hypothetical protein
MRVTIGSLAVLWQSSHRLRSIAVTTLALLLASHLSAAGRDLAPQRLDTPIDRIRSAAKISNGSTVLWLWTVDSSNAGKNVYGAITSASGSVLVPAKAVWPYIDFYGTGAIASAGGYLLYRNDAAGVQQRTLSNDGELGDPVRVAAMLDDLIVATLPPEVTWTPAVQEAPRIASSGNGFLAVWTERGGTVQSIVARTMDRDGNPIGEAIDLTRAVGTLSDHNVAFGGGLSTAEYLVIWQNGSKLFGARVAADGTVIDPTPFVIATVPNFDRFGIASDGTDFLVAWVDGPAVYGAIVTADAHVAAPRVLISAEAQATLTDPVVAFDGAHYIVASLANIPAYPCYNCGRSNPVKAIRVGRDGVPLDQSAATVAIDPNPDHLAIASSGRDVLITFVSAGDLFATTLHTDIALRADSPVLLFHWFDQLLRAPSITWSGTDYVVAFRYEAQEWDSDGTGEWYLGTMRLSANGSRGPLTVTITGPPRELDVEPPGLASTSTGDIAIAVSEAQELGEMPRATGYSLDDLRPASIPVAPSPVWHQSSDEKTLTVSWPDVWSDERGFNLTLDYKNGISSLPRIPRGTTSVSFPSAADLIAFDLQVWNEGGFASTKVSLVPPRTRAARK